MRGVIQASKLEQYDERFFFQFSEALLERLRRHLPSTPEMPRVDDLRLVSDPVLVKPDGLIL